MLTAANSFARTSPILTGVGLQVEGLSAGYGKVALVRDLSFVVARGQVAALTGENGVGKSTILRALVDRNVRRGGRVLVDGHSLLDGHVGYAPQQSVTTLFPWLRGYENVGLWYATHHRPWTLESAKAFAAELGISVPLDRPVYQLSGGERVKIAILRSLAVEDLRLWILDEPFEGLSLSARRLLHGLIRRVAASGVPVVVTSHRTDDLAQVGATEYLVSGRPVTALARMPQQVPQVADRVAPDSGEASPDLPAVRVAPAGSLATTIVGLIGGLAVWSMVAAIIQRPNLIPGPADVVRQLLLLISRDSLQWHLGATLLRAFLSWAIGAAVATPIGLALGYEERAYSLAAPWLSIARTFPVFALTGVAIGLFPSAGELQRGFLILLTVFLIQLQIVSASAALAPRHRLTMARIYGASYFYRLFFVLGFESLPGMLGGLEATLPLAVIVTLVVETFLIPDVGLGRFVLNALNAADTTTVLATVLWPAIGSALGLAALRHWSRRWKQEM
jgi:ABC-type nitrate/sulfonate/bicarbonate transport system permease component/ABC-type nitrate/sulfonate/bicarbonate transport system ATPase subunit